MTDIAPELVARMVGLIKDLHADHVKHGSHDYVQDFVARTAAIIAEIPKPVDPDLLEAREICGKHRANICPSVQYERGHRDNEPEMFIARECLKRGRELAEQERSEWSNSFADRKDEERG